MTTGAPGRRVVVTGGAGFVGSHLCEALVARGDRVVAVDDLSTGNVENVEALERSEVLAIPIAERRHDGPASTMVLAIARENAASGGFDIGLAWVGDSRAYLVAANVPETLLTRDDSWAADQIETGRLTRQEAMRSPNAHAISQWLGMPIGDMIVHSQEVVLTPGVSLLLCSDGLWNYADEPSALARAFTEAAREAADAALICRALVGFANAAGGADNITVGLLRT